MLTSTGFLFQLLGKINSQFYSEYWFFWIYLFIKQETALVTPHHLCFQAEGKLHIAQPLPLLRVFSFFLLSLNFCGKNGTPHLSSLYWNTFHIGRERYVSSFSLVSASKTERHHQWLDNRTERLLKPAYRRKMRTSICLYEISCIHFFCLYYSQQHIFPCHM